MTRIEECEKLLNEWKTIYEAMDLTGIKHHVYEEGFVNGLEAALSIFKKPSNTQMYIDACTCDEGVFSCDKLACNNRCSLKVKSKNIPDSKICINCGRRFIRSNNISDYHWELKLYCLKSCATEAGFKSQNQKDEKEKS